MTDELTASIHYGEVSQFIDRFMKENTCKLIERAAERLAEDGWNNVTLFKTVQSLTTDGYLEVVGLEKTVKTYARKLAPSMSKDDYYASVLIKRGIDSSSIANITAALIGAKDKQAKEKNAEVIAKLEEIIDTLKNDEE